MATSRQTAKELGDKLENVQLARSTAEADLAIEKQWRVTLQVRGCGQLGALTRSSSKGHTTGGGTLGLKLRERNTFSV